MLHPRPVLIGAPTLLDRDMLLFHARYLTGTVNGTAPGGRTGVADPTDVVAGVIMARSGNGTWAGAEKLYFSALWMGINPWSHICGTINGVQVRATLCLQLVS